MSVCDVECNIELQSYSSPCSGIFSTIESLGKPPGEEVQRGSKHGLRDFGCSKQHGSPSDGRETAEAGE